MGFTIKCNKCQNEVTLRNGDTKSGNKIQLIPDVSSESLYHSGYTVHGIDIYCENQSCKNSIEIK